MLQLIMEEQRFATVMWGGFDFIADGGGADPARQEWLMECTGLQASDCYIIFAYLCIDSFIHPHHPPLVTFLLHIN